MKGYKVLHASRKFWNFSESAKIQRLCIFCLFESVSTHRHYEGFRAGLLPDPVEAGAAVDLEAAAGEGGVGVAVAAANDGEVAPAGR